jgi:hypothetical protein
MFQTVNSAGNSYGFQAEIPAQRIREFFWQNSELFFGEQGILRAPVSSRNVAVRSCILSGVNWLPLEGLPAISTTPVAGTGTSSVADGATYLAKVALYLQVERTRSAGDRGEAVYYPLRNRVSATQGGPRTGRQRWQHGDRLVAQQRWSHIAQIQRAYHFRRRSLRSPGHSTSRGRITALLGAENWATAVGGNAQKTRPTASPSLAELRLSNGLTGRWQAATPNSSRRHNNGHLKCLIPLSFR